MVYLRDFTFHSEDEEFIMHQMEERQCINICYPLGILPQRGVERVEFDPVTIFYGGNGSGKSTMLNLIAAKLRLLREIPFDPSEFFDWYINGHSHTTVTGRYLHVDGVRYNEGCSDEWKGIPADSRILTSEDVFDKMLATRGRNIEIDRQREAEAQKWLDYRFRGVRTNLQSLDGPEYEAWKKRNEMRKKSMGRFLRDEVGFNIKTGSNGENAFEFFLEKMNKSALYLLDEPENSLSAGWQVKLAQFIEGMARFEKCQFVIATHSPFVLGIKEAKIYNLDAPGTPVQKWTELQNVREYYDFFKAHETEFSES